MKNRQANYKSKVLRGSESQLLPSTSLPPPLSSIPSTPPLLDTGERRGTWQQDTWAGDLGRASWTEEPAISWP